MLLRIAICTFGLIVSAQTAVACSPIYDERTPDQIRANSAPVAMDRQCRLINGGVYDSILLGPAEALGDGRFQQVVGDRNQAKVYVADCNTREATLLLGAITSVSETSCGPDHTFANLTGSNAMMSLAEGDTLHDLVAIAQAQGVQELNPLTYFFEFTYPWESKPSYPVGEKDRFDLMCGCKRLYPGTLGAAQ